VYCSNPVDYAKNEAELTTEEWKRVFSEAAELGVMQVHLSGGEPVVRDDLLGLVEHARRADLYSNLITGGTLLDRGRLLELRNAGLDHVQVSLQDSEDHAADEIAGLKGHARKLEVARWVKEIGLPLTINVVLHRFNIDRVPELIELAASLGADRLELANTQFYAWALENRGALLPARAQCEAAEASVRAARERWAGRMEIAYVLADYYSSVPKPCMGGWASSYMLITPDGEVLPCHAARVMPHLRFDSVRGRPLAEIWNGSPALEAYRGDHWMLEPCRGCERKAIDFGGCRCQAYLLSGNAALADPVCGYSPAHGKVVDAIAARTEVSERDLVYRNRRNSLRLSAGG
jgi:pyrroloquinoline quinone biosynthesis protein E